MPSAAKPLRAGSTAKRSGLQNRTSLKVGVNLTGAGHTEWIGNEKSAPHHLASAGMGQTGIGRRRAFIIPNPTKYPLSIVSQCDPGTILQSDVRNPYAWPVDFSIRGLGWNKQQCRRSQPSAGGRRRSSSGFSSTRLFTTCQPSELKTNPAAWDHGQGVLLVVAAR